MNILACGISHAYRSRKVIESHGILKSNFQGLRSHGKPLSVVCIHPVLNVSNTRAQSHRFPVWKQCSSMSVSDQQIKCVKSSQLISAHLADVQSTFRVYTIHQTIMPTVEAWLWLTRCILDQYSISVHPAQYFAVRTVVVNLDNIPN